MRRRWITSRAWWEMWWTSAWRWTLERDVFRGRRWWRVQCGPVVVYHVDLR